MGSGGGIMLMNQNQPIPQQAQFSQKSNFGKIGMFDADNNNGINFYGGNGGNQMMMPQQIYGHHN
jgi:hypothetical protein